MNPDLLYLSPNFTIPICGKRATPLSATTKYHTEKSYNFKEFFYRTSCLIKGPAIASIDEINIFTCWLVYGY